MLVGEAVYGVEGDITVREEKGERCGHEARVLVSAVCGVCGHTCEWDGNQRS